MVGHHQIVELICCVIIYILVSCSTKGYTSSVGVQHGNTHSHRIYKLRGSPIWKHTFTQDIQAPWESSMETHIHTRGYTSSMGVQHRNTHSHKRIYKLRGSPAWKHIHTGYTSSVGVQHGNTHSHTRIYKLRGSPAWKHATGYISIGGALVLTWGGQVEDNYTVFYYV